MLDPERWGPLRQRYEHPRPRRLLALDGGGVRGLITLGILETLEARLRDTVEDKTGFRLCDWFDYIAGTSTGAIIATGLARGMAVAELIDFYQRCGVQMFAKSHLLERWKCFYQADPLREQLRRAFGEHTTLEPEHLRCLLLIVTRNASTDSPWPISSNPFAKYNAPDRSDCNLRIPLWQLVRASTAAPIYFPPEIVRLDPTDNTRSFTFVDGGLTPYNNPAFLLYRMATQPAFRLNWAASEGDLLLVSVGTGAAPVIPSHPVAGIPAQLAALPGHLMYAAAVDQDIVCRTVGRCTYGASIDTEISDLIERDEAAEDARTAQAAPLDHDLRRAFLYARYNADLDGKGLAAMGLGHMNAARVQQMDAVDQMSNLLEIGRAAGEAIRLEHFGPFTAPAGGGA